MSLQDDDYHDQQPATRGIRPNTVWWSYDDQYRDPLHWEHDNMIIFIRTCRIMIITFSLYDNMMINKWPYSLVIIIWWSTYDTIMIAEIRPPSATTKIWQLGGRRENMMDQRERKRESWLMPMTWMKTFACLRILWKNWTTILLRKKIYIIWYNMILSPLTYFCKDFPSFWNNSPEKRPNDI